MSVRNLIAPFLAARQSISRDNPLLLDWSRRQWAAWIRSQQQSGLKPPGPRFTIVVALTCIDDLPLHAGLMQLLGIPGIRPAILLVLPTEPMARIVRAQAWREEWLGLVEILSEAELADFYDRTPENAAICVFEFPTILNAERLTALSIPDAVSSLVPDISEGAYFGPISRQRISQSTSTPESRASSIQALQTQDVSLLHPVVEDDYGPSGENSAGQVWQGTIRTGLGRLDLPDVGFEGELVVEQTQGSQNVVVARKQGGIGKNASAVRIRLPARLITTHPQQMRVYAGNSDGVVTTNLLAQIPPSRIKPWMLAAFLNRGGGGNPVIRAFAQALCCRIAYAEDEPEILREIPVVWGVLRDSDRIIAQAKAQQTYFFYIDHAYFNRGHGKNYRIARNAYDAGRVRDCPGDRLKTLNVKLLPWRTGGREIIVCPPTEYFMEAHGCPDWLETTLARLSNTTDRPVIVRTKPRPGEQAVPLATALQSAHALVTHSSNVAIEAACLGTPVFVSATSAAAPVGSTDLSEIDSPQYPDRSPWLSHLAYNQFSLEEIGNGTAWRLLLELEGRTFV